MEDDLKKNEMEDDLKKKIGRRPQTKPDENLKKWKNGRQPQEQLKKSTLIGCDTIVN